MVAKWFAISVMLASAGLLAAAASARAEVIVGDVAGYAEGNFSYPAGPDAIRVIAGEEERSLSSLLGKATLVIFSDDPCSEETGRILASANWVNEDIQVIVVGAAGFDCDKLHTCVLYNGRETERVTALCDPLGLIRMWCDMYTDTPGVVVLDRWGAVYDRGSIDDFMFLRQQAEFLVESYKMPE